MKGIIAVVIGILIILDLLIIYAALAAASRWDDWEESKDVHSGDV